MKQSDIRDRLFGAMELGVELEKLGGAEDSGYRIAILQEVHRITIELQQAQPNYAERSAKELGDKIINELMGQTLRKAPLQLLVLLPVFALLCGDIEQGKEEVSIDWGLVPRGWPAIG